MIVKKQVAIPSTLQTQWLKAGSWSFDASLLLLIVPKPLKRTKNTSFVRLCLTFVQLSLASLFLKKYSLHRWGSGFVDCSLWKKNKLLPLQSDLCRIQFFTFWSKGLGIDLFPLKWRTLRSLSFVRNGKIWNLTTLQRNHQTVLAGFACASMRF